jgi:hypothetical protein
MSLRSQGLSRSESAARGRRDDAAVIAMASLPLQRLSWSWRH